MMEKIRYRVSPILIYDIDPQLNDYMKETYQISIEDLIQNGTQKEFRAVPLSQFVEPSPIDFENRVDDAFNKFGHAFLNPNFFKTFDVTFPEGFQQEFPEYPTPKQYKLDSIFRSTPWFLWFKDYILEALTFSKGLMMDIPFCFLFVYPMSKNDEIDSIKQKFFSKEFPNIHNFPDQLENRRYYQNNSKFSLVLIKKESDSDFKGDKDPRFQPFVIFEDQQITSNFPSFIHDELFQMNFLNPHLILKQHIDNSNTVRYPKKRFFRSRGASQSEILAYVVQSFSINKYDECLAILEKQTFPSKYFYLINFMKAICRMNKRERDTTDDKGEFKISALENLLDDIPDLEMSYEFLLINGVILFHFAENKSLQQSSFKLFNRLIKLTHKHLRRFQALQSIACGVWYDQIAVLNYRSALKRKVAMNLLMAAREYSRAYLHGHVLRCYAFLQAIITRTPNSVKSLANSRDFFVCGQLANNVYLPLQKSWESLNSFALWKLSRTLATTKQYKSALQLNIILLAAPKSPLVPDLKIFSVLHAYFNFLNINVLPLNSLPLVLIDQERVKFAEYGGFAFKRFNQTKFAPLLRHHQKKFKIVRDNLSMWRKFRRGDEIAVPIVCGEKNAIIIPLSNQRTAEINLSKLSLVDSEQMIASSCDKNELYLASNEQMMVPINFITNKTGPFSITGISFIYWAILQDTLKFTPFKFVALDNQPSLDVSLINFPEEMCVGECCSFTCRLRNFGSADMANVVFIHDAPFSISFRTVRDLKISDKTVSVSLLSQKLKPNESVDIPCFIRGRSPGKFKVKMIFTFLANQPLRWRILPDKRTIRIVQKEHFHTKILDHPLSTSKKLVYITGTTTERPAVIKNVTILGSRTLDEKEEVIPQNSSLSCLREVETMATSSFSISTANPSPPLTPQRQPAQSKIKTSSQSMAALLTSAESTDSIVPPTEEEYEGIRKPMPRMNPKPKSKMKTSSISLTINKEEMLPESKVKTRRPSIPGLPSSLSSPSFSSKDIALQDNIELITDPTTNSDSGESNQAIKLEKPNIKKIHESAAIKKEWREQFLSEKDKGYIEVDIDNPLKSQFNIQHEPKEKGNSNKYTLEGKTGSQKVYRLRGAISAPSIIKLNDQETVEVELKLENVGNCDTPSLIISPVSQCANQFFWVSKVTERMKPMKPGQEITLSFPLFVCNSGVYNIGQFKFKSEFDENSLNLYHILSVY